MATKDEAAQARVRKAVDDFFENENLAESEYNLQCSLTTFDEVMFAYKYAKNNGMDQNDLMEVLFDQ